MSTHTIKCKHRNTFSFICSEMPNYIIINCCDLLLYPRAKSNDDFDVAYNFDDFWLIFSLRYLDSTISVECFDTDGYYRLPACHILSYQLSNDFYSDKPLITAQDQFDFMLNIFDDAIFI